jgi:hypothetical protein
VWSQFHCGKGMFSEFGTFLRVRPRCHGGARQRKWLLRTMRASRYKQQSRRPQYEHVNPAQQWGVKGVPHSPPYCVHLPAIPVPLRDTDCGLPAALSEMLSTAVRVPDAVGLNVTLMLQLAPAAKEVPHVSVWAKSPGSVPLMAIPMMVRLLMPTLVKVTVCGELVVPIVTDPKFT